MDTKALEAIGFTPGESKVYLALLSLGETTTGNIIEKSKITGSKVYELLDKLISKGLVSYIMKEKTKYFQAVSPKRLMDYLDKMESEFNDQKDKIKRIIPELEQMQTSEEDIQTSQVFEGNEGIKTAFGMILETIKANGEYYAFSLGDELKDEKVMLFLQNYHQKRIDKKITVKIIAELQEKEVFSSLNNLKDIEIKYYSHALPTGVFIFGNYVATFKFKDKPTVFVIQSKQIASSYKKFFEDLWKIAKK